MSRLTRNERDISQFWTHYATLNFDLIQDLSLNFFYFQSHIWNSWMDPLIGNKIDMNRQDDGYPVWTYPWPWHWISRRNFKNNCIWGIILDCDTVVLIKFLPYSGATAQTRSAALWGVSGSYGQAPAQQGMSGLVRETSHLWLYSSPSPSLQPILGETATSVLIVLYTFECIMCWVATESLWRYVQGNK